MRFAGVYNGATSRDRLGYLEKRVKRLSANPVGGTSILRHSSCLGLVHEATLGADARNCLDFNTGCCGAL